MACLLSFIFGLITATMVFGDCGDEYKMIGSCYTRIHVCAGWYDWQWKYQGTASANGTTGPTTQHYDSQNGAGQHAVYLLYQELPTQTNMCNCGESNILVGKCNVHIKECFNFNSSTDVANSKVDYFAWAYPVNNTGIQGYYCCGMF